MIKKLNTSITKPPLENVDSEAIVMMEIESMSDAIFERIRNFRLLAFHHSKASMSKSKSSRHKKPPSSKYTSKSDFASCMLSAFLTN